MRLVLIIGVLLAGVGLWLATSRGRDMVISVDPGQQAVVLVSEEVIGTLGPGIHVLDQSAGQSAVIYNTLFEQTAEFPGIIDVSGCPADVMVVYRIGDVEAFHRARAQEVTTEALQPQIVRIAGQLTEFGDDPRTEMQLFLRQELEGAIGPGMALSGLFLSIGACEPQRP